MAENMSKKMLTTREAALLLNVSEKTLANWRNTRAVELPYVKLGSKAVRYRADDLAGFVDAGRVTDSSRAAQR